jgi:hypothetical protein
LPYTLRNALEDKIELLDQLAGWLRRQLDEKGEELDKARARLDSGEENLDEPFVRAPLRIGLRNEGRTYEGLLFAVFEGSPDREFSSKELALLVGLTPAQVGMFMPRLVAKGKIEKRGRALWKHSGGATA